MPNVSYMKYSMRLLGRAVLFTRSRHLDSITRKQTLQFVCHKGKAVLKTFDQIVNDQAMARSIIGENLRGQRGITLLSRAAWDWPSEGRSRTRWKMQGNDWAMKDGLKSVISFGRGID